MSTKGKAVSTEIDSGHDPGAFSDHGQAEHSEEEDLDPHAAVKEGASFLETIGADAAQDLLLPKFESDSLSFDTTPTGIITPGGTTYAPVKRDEDEPRTASEYAEASTVLPTQPSGESTSITSKPMHTAKTIVETRRVPGRIRLRRAVTSDPSELCIRVRGLTAEDLQDSMRPLCDGGTVLLSRTNLDSPSPPFEYSSTKVGEWRDVEVQRSDIRSSVFEPRQARWTVNIRCSLDPSELDFGGSSRAMESSAPEIKICRVRTEKGTDRQTTYRQFRTAFLESIGVRIKPSVAPALPGDETHYAATFDCKGHPVHEGRKLSTQIGMTVDMSLEFRTDQSSGPLDTSVSGRGEGGPADTSH
ncbi:hypothetical protein IAU59_003170 [Kwoniella sp. CBS 9459]